ncbi:MAG: hypothetical protein RLN96_08160, partial [Pseudomonadales bacterium]
HQIDRYRPDLRIPDMKDDLLPDVYKWDISALVDEYFGDAETSFRKFFGEGNYADHDSAFRLNAYREFAETFSEQEQEQEDKPITVIDLECGNGFGGLFLCKALNDQFDGEREIRLHLVDSSQLVVNTIIGEHAKVFVNHGMPDFAPILVQERSEDYLQNCDFENSGSVIVLWERQIGTRGDPGNFLQRLATQAPPGTHFLVGYYRVDTKGDKNAILQRYRSSKSDTMISAVREKYLQDHSEQKSVNTHFVSFCNGRECDPNGLTFDVVCGFDIVRPAPSISTRVVAHQVRCYEAFYLEELVLGSLDNITLIRAFDKKASSGSGLSYFYIASVKSD